MSSTMLPPRAMGVIMDGNRRWASERGLPTLAGHRAGLEKAKEALRWAREAGVEELTLYAFSTENWQRGAEEVSQLLALFDYAFSSWLAQLQHEGVRVRFIGERSHFSTGMQSQMATLEQETSAGTQGTLVIALSYGGRAEILAATNTLLKSGVSEVSESDFREVLWTAGLWEPDIVLRTGGEHRLSNFLTWQSVYSELFFTDTLWPDLSHAEFLRVLEEYALRERRRGR